MKIHAEPFISDDEYYNEAMITDFYEFSMANCLFEHGYKDSIMVFDMLHRKNPDNLGYSISCGQRKLTKFLLNYHFTDTDLKYLKAKGMSDKFLAYLKKYKWKGTMYGLKEGTICYPQVPIIRIEADIVGAILIETYLLQTMNYHSLIATKATRISGLYSHNKRNVLEFGARRAQGASASINGAYASIIGGCSGTSNCLAEMIYGSEVKAVGTIAHSFIEFFPSEMDAFRAYAKTYPDNVSLLLDTYNVFEVGLPNLIQLDNEMIKKYPSDPNKRVKSARIDSGDLSRTYKRLRSALDKAGKSYIKLVASNSLDEKKMQDMEVYEKAKYDSYGVGENLITSATDPYFGGVYKLVAIKEKDKYIPKMKCSESTTKAIIPGKLMAYRIYDKDDLAQCDLIALDDEVIKEGEEIEVVDLNPDAFKKHIKITPYKIEKLLVPYIIDGKKVIELPTITQIKDYVKDQIENHMWESELRSEFPHEHYVDLTLKVYQTREELYNKLHGGKL